MEYAYLGLFQKVFEWVLSRIFDPVFRFVSNLLTTVLSWLFEEVLAPVLLPVLKEALNFFIDLWLLIYSRFLYLLFSGLLKLIDYLEKAFDVFIGLSDVTYTEANGQKITGTLIEVLMQQKTIRTAFWVLTLGGLGLALVLTIYATAKSAFDLDFDNKRPVSKVLAAMMKTFIQFFTVPFFVFFLLKLSAVILKGVTSVLSFGGETTLGRIVFTIASLDAAKQEGYNISDAAAGIEVGVNDDVRAPFYKISGSNLKDYGKITDVDAVFHLQKFDYLIGFIAAVFLLFTIGFCLIIFVQRIFELCLLYLASPYFVCMIPLDDGERFSRWREMFIGKCFTGFGSVVGMRMFLMICPMIMGNRIRFGTASSPEMDYMMKLFFIAGGAWAVYKSGPMITSLISSQAGSAEASTAATVGGMLYAYTAGKVISKGQQLLHAPLGGKMRGKQEEGRGGKDDNKGRFDGKNKGNPTASRGIPGRTGAPTPGAGYGRPGYPGYGRPGYAAYGRPGYTAYGRPGYSAYGRSGYAAYGRPGYPGAGRAGYSGAGRPGYGQRAPLTGRPGPGSVQAAGKPGQALVDPWESKASSGGTSSKIAEEKKASAAAAGFGRVRSASAPPAPGRGIVRPGSAAVRFGAEKPGAVRTGAEKPKVAVPGVQKPGAVGAGAEKPGAAVPGVQKPGAARTGIQKPGANAYGAYRSPYRYGYYRSPYGRRPMPASAYGLSGGIKASGPSRPQGAPSSPGVYAPPSVDVFAAAAARGGKAAKPYLAGMGQGTRAYPMGRAYAYGSPYGSYRMNWQGSGYTFHSTGAAVSRSFPGSAVRSGAEITRAGYTGHVQSSSGSYSSYSGLTDADSGSASSSGGAAGSSAGSANAQIGGNERRYQASPLSVPASVRSVPSGVQLKYSDVGIRGISHDKGSGGRQFTRRNSR